MSEEKFNMSSEQVDGSAPAAHGGLQLALYPESHYSNSSTSASPDSNSSISNMSETEAGSSPDINMLESCIHECPPVANLYNTTLTQCDVLCGVTMNVNQTFTAMAVNDSVNFWNENLSLSGNEDSGSKRYQTFSDYTNGVSVEAGASPDSTENDFCSLSSGEMIVRSNSFCLEDQAPLIVSSLDESSFSAAADLRAFPAHSNLLSTTLPDVCENSSDRVVEENTGHPCLGVTFTQADNCELPSEENHGALSSPLVALPSENEGGLLMTFICETSENCRKEANYAGAEPELAPGVLGAITPEQGKTFVTPQSAIQVNKKGIYTSSPIQSIGSKTPNLPSFSESPCCGPANTPGLHPARPTQTSVRPARRAVGGEMLSANKVKKMEVRKFPKSDFSNVKSKIVTRIPLEATAPGSTSSRKASKVVPNNKPIEAHKGAASIKTSPAKLGGGTPAISAATKMLSVFQRRVNKKIAVLGEAIRESHAVKKQDDNRALQSEKQPPAVDSGSAGECSDTTCEAERAASQQTGSELACRSSSEKSPDTGGQIGPQPAPNKVVSGKNEVGSGSALGPNKPPVPQTRPRCSSEGSSMSQTPKEKRPALKFSTSLTIPRARAHQGQTKPGNLNCTSQRKQVAQPKETDGSAESSPKEVKKSSLVEVLSKSTAAGEDGKSRFRGKAPVKQTRGSLLSQAPAARPRLTSLSAGLRLGDLGKNECRTPKAGATPQSKQKSNTGSNNRLQPTGGSSKKTLPAAGIKLQLNGSRPPHTPTRSSLMGPPPTPSSRLRKTPGASRGLGEASAQGHATGSTQVPSGAPPKSTPFKSVFRSRLLSTPGKNPGTGLTPSCKLTATTSKGASSSTAVSLKRSASAGLIQPTSGAPVDKNKAKTGTRQQQPPPPAAAQPNQSNGPPDVVPPASVAEDRTKDHVIQQLRGLLAAGNCRFEAVAVVLQQILAERDDATKQCRELSQELVSLQGELVGSVHSSERLEKEKEELRVSLEDALHRVQEQHHKDLQELEQRLQAFYQAEWDKVHVAYQEEADKCKTLMQQQQEELKAKHEVLKLELERRHEEQLQCVKQQYETSLDELRQVHNQELQSLDKTLKEAEASLSGRIEALTEENDALTEKLAAEERRREELAQRSQKDSHTLYLEQELESLKVVLEIKTEQLHQQEKKLMEIDKLTERNVKLDESLIKVQQENEDLKARMERHAALSRQLSTEQAVLQESLHKESKVNKRLSMENEELLWKLNNGDLSSPRKVSPTSSSPSHSFSLHSPRSSGLFSSPPVSPR